MGKTYCMCCSNYSGKEVNGKVVTLHRIPQEKNLNKAWRVRLDLVRKDVREYMRICSEHFVNKCGPQPWDSVPSIFSNMTFKTNTLDNSVTSTPQDEAVDVAHKETAFLLTLKTTNGRTTIETEDGTTIGIADVLTIRTADVSTKETADMSTTRTADVSTTRTADVSTIRTADLSTTRTADVSTKETADLSTMETTNLSVMRTADVSNDVPVSVIVMSMGDVSTVTMSDVSSMEMGEVSVVKTTDVSTVTMSDVSSSKTADVSSMEMGQVSVVKTTDVSPVTMSDVSSMEMGQVSVVKTTDVSPVTMSDVSSMEMGDVSVVNTTAVSAEQCSQGQRPLPSAALLFHTYSNLNSAPILNNDVCASSTQNGNVMPSTSSTSTQTDDVSNRGYQPLRFEHISDNDDIIQVYTGMPNAFAFKTIFDEVCHEGDDVSNSGESCKELRNIDQFLLTLMRFKLGLLIEDLSFRFAVSKSTCSSVFNKWVEILYKQLSFVTHWPSRSQIDNTMPDEFKEGFPQARVIIECHELLSEKSPSLILGGKFSSHMKWKTLIGVTPNGDVSFVSDLWNGCLSDRQIVVNSGILDLCEDGDAVITVIEKKSILISHPLDVDTPQNINMVSFVSPPMRSSRKVSTPQGGGGLAGRVASCRSDARRHIARVTSFRILQTLPESQRSVTQIWKICNNLTALIPPIYANGSDGSGDSDSSIEDDGGDVDDDNINNMVGY